MRQTQQAAEAAADVGEAFDGGDGVVRRADQPGAVFAHDLDEVIRRGVGRQGKSQGVVEILLQPGGGPVSCLVEGLLARFGQVNRHHQPPLLAVHGVAVQRRAFLGDLPLFGQRHDAPYARIGAQRKDAGAVLAGQLDAGRRLHAGHGDGEVRLAVGPQVQERVAQFKPVGLVGDGLGLGQKALNEGHRLVHHLALPGGINTQHVGVGAQSAGPDAEHDASARQVVEQDEAVGDHERVVVWQADDAGAEADVAGAFGRRGHEHLGRGDGFPAGAVVLADPGLVVAEVVEPLEQLEVAFQSQGGILAEPVEGSQEDTKRQPLHERHDNFLIYGIAS